MPADVYTIQIYVRRWQAILGAVFVECGNWIIDKSITISPSSHGKANIPSR